MLNTLLYTVVVAASLQSQIASIAAKADGVVGVAAIDLETGRRVSLHGDERFPMASVVKLPVAIGYLQRVDRGEDSLTREVTLTPDDFRAGVSPIADEANGKPIVVTMGRLLDAMVRESDNTAVDYVLNNVVPPAQVMRVLADIRVKGIDVSRQEGQVIAELEGEMSGKPLTRRMWTQRAQYVPERLSRAAMERHAKDPRDTSTPNGMADLLAKLFREKVGLFAESREILLRAMRETETGAHRLKARLPAGATIAHKTGTMGASLNDVGIVTSPDGKHHFAIAVFTKAAYGGDQRKEEAVVADIARAIYDGFTQ